MPVKNPNLIARVYIITQKESLSDVRFHAAARLGDLIGMRHLLDSGKVHADSRDKVKINKRS